MSSPSFVTPSIRTRHRHESKINFDITKPTIIFTSGPTGAGKSGLLEKVFDAYYKKSYDTTFRNFLIDDYVENSESYKNKVKDIIRNFNCNKDEPTESCNFNEPSKPLLEAFAEAYFSVRQDGPCGLPPKPEYGCKLTMFNQIIEAIQANDNILIETTGKKIPIDYLKTLEKFTRIHNYNVLFVFAFVKFETLMERNKTRASRQMKEFIESNYDNPAPRLPDISPNVFKQTTTGIEKSLVLLRNKCLRLRAPNKEVCGPINSTGSFNLLLFSNDERKARLIYDSRVPDDNIMTDADFIKYIRKFNLSVELAGEKTKKTKKAKKAKAHKTKYSKKKRTFKRRFRNRK